MISSNVQFWPCYLWVYLSGIEWSSQIDVPLRFDKLLTREDGHDTSAEKLRWLSVLRMKNCCDQLRELLHHGNMCYLFCHESKSELPSRVIVIEIIFHCLQLNDIGRSKLNS